MDITVLVKGVVLGFSIAAPVGPIGVLCIRRTLAYGRGLGLATGLGAATADAIYGSIAAFGITFVSTLLIAQQTWLRLLGGAFLCYLGIRTLMAASSPVEGSVQREGLGGAYISTFLLTITNPLTIISFAAVFAGLGVSTGGDYGSAALMVVGVFSGSALWWFMLSGGISLFRAKFSLQGLSWVNRVSGGIIMAFGVLALASLFT
jgi:threonine/homoserine/homoserine lactone efflux protein